MRILLQSITEECNRLESRFKYTQQRCSVGQEKQVLSTVQQGTLLLWGSMLLRQEMIFPFNKNPNSHKIISLLFTLYLP